MKDADTRSIRYKTTMGVLNVLAWAGYGFKKTNLNVFREMPQDKGFVISANHSSTADAFFIAMAVPRPTHFLGRRKTMWKNAFWSFISNLGGTIPVEEEKGSNIGALHAGLGVVRERKALGMFPEGATQKRKKSFEGRTGATRVALMADVPIVPVGMHGTSGTYVLGVKWPLPARRVKMTVGRPWYFPTLKGETSKEVTRLVTDVVMHDIRKLSGFYGVPEELRRPLYERGLNARQELAKLLRR